MHSVCEVGSGMKQRKQQVEMRTVRASVTASNPIAGGANPGAPGAAAQRASIL
jgi:hypothetical protein